MLEGEGSKRAPFSFACAGALRRSCSVHFCTLRPRTSLADVGCPVSRHNAETDVPSDKDLKVIQPRRRAAPVFACGRCLARHDKGKKLKTSLKAALKSTSVGQTLKRPRLITTSCFGICPRQAIVLASDRTLRAGRYVVLEKRTDAGRAVAILLEPALEPRKEKPPGH